MKSMLFVFLGLTGIAFAQNPTIRTVQNSASNIVVGLPNSGIAQGSIMVIYGSDLGPATLVAGTFPLQTTLGGTSVQVTVGGKTTNAIMFYTLASQVAAILPSSTPVGTGTFTVTFNGKVSTAAPITVVQNGFGTYLLQGTTDAVAVFQKDNSIVAPSNAANPGDVVAFWGTGLGPVTFDESNPAVQSDMTNVPIEAYVGGKTANVLFRGRNGCCAAADNVYIQIPAGVSGCATPVVFKIGNIVSNTATMAVAASGKTCTPTIPSVSATDLSNWISKGTFSGGGVTLSRTVITTLPITVGPVTVPGSTTKTDSGGASFYKITVPPGGVGLASQFDIASFGSCNVLSFSGTGTTLPVSFQSLDAGASIGVNGPNGSKTLTKTTAAGLTSYSATFDQTATYLGAGAYTVTGPGGPDVGSFTANITLPQPLVWTNQASITSVDRTKGVTVNWTGGDLAGYVTIGGTSILTASGAGSSTVVATFTCTAKTSDLTFTVPPVVLLALPPSGTQTTGGISVSIPGNLSISGVSASSTFKASGLDYSAVSSSVVNINSVTFQ